MRHQLLPILRPSRRGCCAAVFRLRHRARVHSFPRMQNAFAQSSSCSAAHGDSDPHSPLEISVLSNPPHQMMEGSDHDQDFGVWRNLWRLEKEDVNSLTAPPLALCARSAGAGWYRHRTLSINLAFMANSHTATWSRGWWLRRWTRAAEEMVERGRAGDGERQRKWSVHGDKGLIRVEVPSEPSLLLHCSSSASLVRAVHSSLVHLANAFRLSPSKVSPMPIYPAHSKCMTTLPLTHPTDQKNLPA